MSAASKASWIRIVGVFAAVGGVGLVVSWWLMLHALDYQIVSKRAALKRLHVGGRLAPSRAVVDYLTKRAAAFQARSDAAMEFVAPSQSLPGGQADPQLFFQQRVHEVQQTLERLAASHATDVPLQLGLPKDLPPADVVPRFLAQLALIEELARVMLETPGVVSVTSFKVEDPQTISETAATEAEPLVTRLPVRIRLRCSVEAVGRVLDGVARLRPLVDVVSLRIQIPVAAAPAASAGGGNSSSIVQGTAGKGSDATASGAVLVSTKAIDVDLTVSRYLPVSAVEQAAAAEARKKKEPAHGTATARQSSGARRAQRTP